VPDSFDWATEVAQIKSSLAVIESAAASAVIPPALLAEVKSAVDHCRTTLWAVVLATTNDNYESTALILASRMQRVQEMCGRVQEDVTQGRMWKETPGLGRFVATLGETERSVRSLLDQSEGGGTVQTARP
jgi:ABC-type methionine transport system ATPase subunit